MGDFFGEIHFHWSKEGLFLLQLAILIGLPSLIWARCGLRRFMPLVVVQILAGIAFGPTILGSLAPELSAFLFPPASLDWIKGIANLAIILFVFQTGFHLDPKLVIGQGRSFVAAATGSVLVPTVLGGIAGLVCLQIWPELAGSKGNPLVFGLAMGIATGVTALPVLSAILGELGLKTRELGKLSLGLATVNDGMLWVLVALLMLLANGGGIGQMLYMLIGTATYLYVAGRWLPRAFAWASDRRLLDADNFTNNQLVLILCWVAISSIITELLGMHFILGAFVAGAVLPKDLAHKVEKKMELVTNVALLPCFFMITGLRTSFDIGSSEVWMVFAIMSVVSIIGKLAGTALPFRYFGTEWRRSLQLGTLMSCKGLMEVILLTMLVQMGVISTFCFSAMLIMAVVTTGLTQPMLRWTSGRQQYAALTTPRSPVQVAAE